MPLIIRPENLDDYYQTEHMTQKAFWNLHNPGCSEHLLVRKLRSDPAYLPGLYESVGFRLRYTGVHARRKTAD